MPRTQVPGRPSRTCQTSTVHWARVLAVWIAADGRAMTAGQVYGYGGRAAMPGLRGWFFLLFAVVYLYAFPYFDKLRSANEMPRLLMTQEMVDRGVFYLDRRLPEFGSTG